MKPGLPALRVQRARLVQQAQRVRLVQEVELQVLPAQRESLEPLELSVPLVPQEPKAQQVWQDLPEQMELLV